MVLLLEIEDNRDKTISTERSVLIKSGQEKHHVGEYFERD